MLEEPGYLEKSMFGCLARYGHGRLCLLLSSGEELWNDLLIPIDHRFYDSILRDYQNVVPPLFEEEVIPAVSY